MGGRRGIRSVVAAAVVLAAGVRGAAGAAAQESYTDLPLGLTLVEVLTASGLPVDASDPAGWTSQRGGGGGGPGPAGAHYSAVESSVRIAGVSADSVRAALESALRSELAERGAQILERPGGEPGPPGRGARGDAWSFPWRAPGSGARGWITLLVLPDGEDRVRLLATSVEERGAGPPDRPAPRTRPFDPSAG